MKSAKKLVKYGIFSIILAIIYILVYCTIFAGENGNIRENAPIEWMLLAVIPFTIGSVFSLVGSQYLIRGTVLRRRGRIQSISEEKYIEINRQLQPIFLTKIFLIFITGFLLLTLLSMILSGAIEWTDIIDAPIEWIYISIITIIISCISIGYEIRRFLKKKLEKREIILQKIN